MLTKMLLAAVAARAHQIQMVAVALAKAASRPLARPGPRPQARLRPKPQVEAEAEAEVAEASRKTRAAKSWSLAHLAAATRVLEAAARATGAVPHLSLTIQIPTERANGRSIGGSAPGQRTPGNKDSEAFRHSLQLGMTCALLFVSSKLSSGSAQSNAGQQASPNKVEQTMPKHARQGLTQTMYYKVEG